MVNSLPLSGLNTCHRSYPNHRSNCNRRELSPRSISKLPLSGLKTWCLATIWLVFDHGQFPTNVNRSVPRTQGWAVVLHLPGDGAESASWHSPSRLGQDLVRQERPQSNSNRRESSPRSNSNQNMNRESRDWSRQVLHQVRVPRETKMLKGHLLRVIYHQVY